MYTFHYIIHKKRFPAWLVLLLLMTISPVFAHAYEYVTLNGGTGYTTSYLISRCSDKHVKITGDAVTLNVSGNLSIKEIYAPNTNVNIVLSNHAKFYIDQEVGVTMSAMNVKSLTISGQGYIYITGNGTGVGLHGGKLEVTGTTAQFTARNGDAIVCKEGSSIEINNSVVTISAPGLAVDHWEESSHYDISSFTISGSQSHVTVHGSIMWVDSFNIYDGWVSITNTPKMTAVLVKNALIGGGKTWISQVGSNNSNSSTYGGLYVSHNAMISNCELEINAVGDYGIYVSNELEINNAKLKSFATSGRIAGIFGWVIKILGNSSNSEVRAVGAKDGICAQSSVEIANHFLLARGYNGDGIVAPNISFNVQQGSTYEAYGNYPVVARRSVPNPTFNLKRPIWLVGQLEASNPNSIVSGGGVIDFTSEGYYQKIFATSNGRPYRGYVKITRPNIALITGVNNPFLLRGSSSATKYVLPGDTMQVNMSPLNPYLSYENHIKTVKLYRRNEYGSTLINSEEVSGDTYFYTFTQQDLNCFVTAEVELDAYDGSLQSRQYYVRKIENWALPTKPTLAFLSGNIRVTNARTIQEYILLSESQFNQFLNNPDDASWWKNARVPIGTTLTMTGGTMGSINYVVTRYKESDTMLPGYFHEHESILLDNNITLTTGLSLSVTAASSGNIAEMEYLDGKVTYTTKKNGVLKVTFNPLPGNATDFEGILGKDFSIAYSVTYGSNLCQLYANAACTTPLSDNTRYKTVYLKPLFSGGNQLEMIASLSPDNGGPDDVIASIPLYLNVSEDDGTFMPYMLLVNNGDTLINYNNIAEGIPFVAFPSRASLPGDVIVTYRTVQGPFPSVASQVSRIPTFTVDKEKRTVSLFPNTSEMLTNHVYFFSVSHRVNNETYGYGYLTVKVVEKPIYSLSINPQEAELQLGGSLDLNITSDLDEAWRQYISIGHATCTSSDPSVATAAYNNSKQTYVVTMTNDPEKIGKSATITLNINGIEAACVVTAAGETYPLWIEGKQVNSANKDDIKGDGTVKYEGGATGGLLRLTGSTINGAGNTPGIKSEIPMLTIDVRTPEITVSRGSYFYGDTYFTGDGFFKTSTSNDNALYARNIVVRDSVRLRAWSDVTGFYASELSVVGDSAEVQAYSYNDASMVVENNLNGTITRPQGAVWNPETGWVAVGPDNLDNYVTAAYVYVKGKKSTLVGDVNCDGSVNAADVTALYAYILNHITTFEATSDVNGDHSINAADVTAVYKIILGK